MANDWRTLHLLGWLLAGLGYVAPLLLAVIVPSLLPFLLIAFPIGCVLCLISAFRMFGKRGLWLVIPTILSSRQLLCFWRFCGAAVTERRACDSPSLPIESDLRGLCYALLAPA